MPHPTGAGAWERSRHIPERLGFREEGTRRQTVWIRDDPHDEVIYGMLAAEWAARRR